MLTQRRQAKMRGKRKNRKKGTRNYCDTFSALKYGMRD
jgi:hypothetical protein